MGIYHRGGICQEGMWFDCLGYMFVCYPLNLLCTHHTHNHNILFASFSFLLISSYLILYLFRFGQLGCSGFIISDENGCFVSRKTKAYLGIGDDAFRYVEKLLLDKFGIQPIDTQKTKQGGGDEDVMNPDWNLPSVGHIQMDEEHEQCEAALSQLLSTPNADTLTQVMELLTSHFQHEENLMKVSGFGNPSEKFSPYANHVSDHGKG